MGILVSWLVLTFSFVVASKLIDGFQLKGGGRAIGRLPLTASAGRAVFRPA